MRLRRRSRSENMFRQRIRICYGIGGRQRFLSHRDVMRTMIRALRRSLLPLRLSEGFHVRPKVTFALARGVGIASRAEWMEFELSDWVDPQLVRSRFEPQLPEGFNLRQLRAVYPDQRAIVVELTYRVELDQPPEDLRQRVTRLLASPSIEVQRSTERKTHTVDVRPLLVDIQLEPPGVLSITASASDEGTLRIEEILSALGLDDDEVARSLVTRTEAVLADQQQQRRRA